MIFPRRFHAVLFSFALLATACGSDETKKATGQSIEGMPGQWVDASVADVLEANPNPNDAGCATILESSLDVIRIDASGGVFMKDPESRQELKIYTISNGELIPEPQYAEIFKNMQITIQRVGERLSLEVSYLKDGRWEKAGSVLLGRVSEENAAKFDETKSSCAHAKIPGRISDLPIKDGRMVITGDVAATHDYSADKRTGYASCSLSDGKVSLFFLKKEASTSPGGSHHSSEGLQATLPAADLASGREVTISLPTSTMTLPGQRDSFFFGACTARAKRTKHVFDVVVDCPEMQRRVDGKDQKVRVTGTYSCLANSLEEKD